MIKSMTGYGRATSSFDGMDITLELKSVNHRYFEFSSRVPRNFGFLDEKLKSFFREEDIVCRISGYEILVLCKNIGSRDMRRKLEQLMADM